MLLYVTEALEPGEASELRAHLITGCPACAGALAEAEATVHQLPLSLPPLTPPEGAWEKLEMRIAMKDAVEGPSLRMADAPLPSQKPSRALAWLGWAAAAMVAIVMGLMLHGANARVDDLNSKSLATAQELAITQQALLAANDQSNQMSTRLTSLEAKVKTLTTDHDKLLLALDTAKQDFMDHLDKLMHADQYAVAPKEMPGVKGTLFWDKNSGTWTVMASNVPMPAAGKTYELWIITAKGDKIAAGTFMPDASGKAMHEANIPAGMDTIMLAAVTDEPMGGVQIPTGHIQFTSDVTRKQ